MKCKAMTKSGKPCNATPTSSGYCYRHDPEITKEEKINASAKGALMKHKRSEGIQLFRDVTGVGDVMEILTKAIDQVWSQELKPQQANSIGYLVSVALRLREQVILEDR